MWLTLSERDATYFALHEVRGVYPPRVVHLVLRKRVKLVAFPPVPTNDYQTRQIEQYNNAVFWAKEIFGVSFYGIGYERLPEAFKTVCRFGFDGIYIAREDSGKAGVMICDGKDLQIVGSREVG